MYNVPEGIKDGDLLWIKVTGPSTELSKLNKKAIGEAYVGHSNFKFDRIPTKDEGQIIEERLTNAEVFDSIIEKSTEPEPTKKYLFKLWRELCE